ncbi:MAG: hypothetical protein ACLQBD_12910 [Syntrophobacteraceae bacterium]
MVFSFDALSIDSRIIDTNILALKPGSAPMSLGLRPQVLKLRYVAPGIAGNFLHPQFPFTKHVNCGQENERTPIKPVSPGIEALFVGETESLIYSPFSIHDNVLVDAILQSPVGNAGGGLVELPSERCDAEDQLSFLPMMCPACGWDLEGEKNSLVLFCRNCSIAWQSGGSDFENVNFAFPSARNGGDATIYLPFWRLNANVTGLQLRSYADLVRLANLPRVVQREWEKKQPHFWVPAFKVQPHLFLRLSTSLTTLQPEPESNTPLPKSGILPVTIPAGKALESLKVLIASLVIPKKFIFPLLPALSFSMNDQMLVYLRFCQRGSELIQEDFNLSIQASAVSWGQLI